MVLGRWYGAQGRAEGGREESRLVQDEEITIRNKYKSQKRDPSSSSTSPMPRNPQASPSMGTTNMDVDDEDNAKRKTVSGNDDSAKKKHRGGIEVMNSGIDVSEI